VRSCESAADTADSDFSGTGLTVFAFRVAGVPLAVRAESLEYIRAQLIPTPLPRVPAHISGVVADGEEALPILDLRMLLGLQSTEEVDGIPRTMVLKSGELKAGVVVRPIGLVEIPPSDIRPPQSFDEHPWRTMLESELSLNGRTHALLDVERVLEAARV